MILPFMKLKWISLSASTILMAYIFYYTNAHNKGFKKGIDFAGGTKIEMQKNEKVDIQKLKDFFQKNKIEATIQEAAKESKDVIKIEIDSKQEVDLQARAEKEKSKLNQADLSVNSIDYLKYLMVNQMSSKDPLKIVFLSASKVGPTIGAFLQKSAIKLLLIALVLIIFYVSFRFHFNFALGAMIALLHDLFMSLGLIGYLGIPLSIPVVAALLTILGYSINDTIVVFDRIRENTSGSDTVGIEHLVNKSITASLSRTLITSLTTLIAVGTVYLLGGEGLNDMAFVLILGVIIGTYSSVFIASPVVVIWNKFSNR